MAKRIQMRKNRFLAIQKIAEQKKLNVDGPDGEHAPKQTVSTRPIDLNIALFLENVRYLLVGTFVPGGAV